MALWGATVDLPPPPTEVGEGGAMSGGWGGEKYLVVPFTWFCVFLCFFLGG